MLSKQNMATQAPIPNDYSSYLIVSPLRDWRGMNILSIKIHIFGVHADEKHFG